MSEQHLDERERPDSALHALASARPPELMNERLLRRLAAAKPARAARVSPFLARWSVPAMVAVAVFTFTCLRWKSPMAPELPTVSSREPLAAKTPGPPPQVTATKRGASILVASTRRQGTPGRSLGVIRRAASSPMVTQVTQSMQASADEELDEEGAQVAVAVPGRPLPAFEGGTVPGHVLPGVELASDVGSVLPKGLPNDSPGRPLPHFEASTRVGTPLPAFAIPTPTGEPP